MFLKTKNGPCNCYVLIQFANTSGRHKRNPFRNIRMLGPELQVLTLQFRYKGHVDVCDRRWGFHKKEVKCDWGCTSALGDLLLVTYRWKRECPLWRTVTPFCATFTALQTVLNESRHVFNRSFIRVGEPNRIHFHFWNLGLFYLVLPWETRNRVTRREMSRIFETRM